MIEYLGSPCTYCGKGPHACVCFARAISKGFYARDAKATAPAPEHSAAFAESWQLASLALPSRQVQFYRLLVEIEIAEQQLALLKDDPENDATDFAHPACWRGNDRGVEAAAEWIRKALDGETKFCMPSAALTAVCQEVVDMMKQLAKARTALEEIDKSIDSLCGLIRMAQYNADERQQGLSAWEPVADVMYNGTMGMIREEIRAALAQEERKNDRQA